MLAPRRRLSCSSAGVVKANVNSAAKITLFRRSDVRESTISLDRAFPKLLFSSSRRSQTYDCRRSDGSQSICFVDLAIPKVLN